MTLHSLRLQQYRSYLDRTFELGPGVNIVVGPNAAGKTNLLEAVMVACIGKSYRIKDSGLIKNGNQWARIDAITDQNVQRTIKLQTEPTGRVVKSFEIDDKVYKRLPQNISQPIVLFEPNNMRLIEGEPTSRREYLDDLIEQYVPEYEKHRAHYKRVLAQRNALLKQGPRGSSQLFAWNLRLADLGSHLVTKRLELISTINDQINNLYQSLSEQNKQVRLTYQSSIKTDNYSSNLLTKLEASTELDQARGFTGNGPHRDDFIINFADQPALLSASRGEIRTLMLTLKIIEMSVLEKERGVKPLLLLDDVFSELDESRRTALTDYLRDSQTIITTTDADMIKRHFETDHLHKIVI